jgi:hypothetical protein
MDSVRNDAQAIEAVQPRQRKRTSRIVLFSIAAESFRMSPHTGLVTSILTFAFGSSPALRGCWKCSRRVAENMRRVSHGWACWAAVVALEKPALPPANSNGSLNWLTKNGSQMYGTKAGLTRTDCKGVGLCQRKNGQGIRHALIAVRESGSDQLKPRSQPLFIRRRVGHQLLLRVRGLLGAWLRNRFARQHLVAHRCIVKKGSLDDRGLFQIVGR